jgi:hypothetical protein
MSAAKSSALFLIVAITVGSIGQTLALDNGQNGTPQHISAQLKAEDQHLIASADLMAADGKLLGMFFTANSDRSVGYIVQSDKPFGDPATLFSVYKRRAHVRVYDANVPVPAQVFLKASDEVARGKCKQLESSDALPKGTCVAYNKTIRNAEQRGQRPMIQAFNVRKNADGSYSPAGALITVTGNFGVAKTPSATSGVVSSIYYSSLPEGATILNATLSYAAYEPYGLSLLKAQAPSR